MKNLVANTALERARYELDTANLPAKASARRSPIVLSLNESLPEIVEDVEHMVEHMRCAFAGLLKASIAYVSSTPCHVAPLELVVRSVIPLHGFLGPRSYCFLSMTCVLLRPIPYRGGLAAGDGSELRTPRMRSVLAAAMLNNVEEAWVRLTDVDNPPSQEDVDAALRWTLLYPKRSVMNQLLTSHGADSTKAGLLVEAALAVEDKEYMHNVSKAHMPSAKHIWQGVRAHCRVETCNWLLRACEAVKLDDSVLAATVLNLDRYYAANHRRVRGVELHRLTLAALCTAMKVAYVPKAHREQILVNSDAKEVPLGFRVIDLCLCAALCTEIALRLVAHRWTFFTMWGWQWNVFEMLTVFLQVLEEIIKAVYSTSRGFGIAQVARILRVVRVIRIVRVFRLVGELRMLVSSLGRSLKALLWTFVVIFYIIYIAAIPIVQVVIDHRIYEGGKGPSYDLLSEHFESLPQAMVCLFQNITSGMSWGLIYGALRDVSELGSLVYLVYVAFALLALLNVVTGVFVENVKQVSKADKDFLIINTVRDLFRDQSGGTSKAMTFDGFMEKISKPEMLEYFEAIDVHPSEATGLFQLLDLDRSGVIDAEEFLSGCFQLRGPAKALDLVLLMQEVRRIHDVVLQLIGSQVEQACAEEGAVSQHGLKKKKSKKDMVSTERAEAVVDEAPNDAEKIANKAANLDEGVRDTE